ncbi:MAG: DUF2231 domain-containing protein [FCB group bacterium]|nr:DUF2231 domain-containing protein [FCB group bacterium]
MPDIEVLHSMFVHFPIALFLAALLFDLLGTFLRMEGFNQAAWWNQALGAVFSIFTIITGFISDNLVGHMEEPFPLFSTHGSLQILSITILFGLVIYRLRNKGHLSDNKRSRWIFLGLEIIAVVFLFYGAHLGAKLANRI